MWNLVFALLMVLGPSNYTSKTPQISTDSISLDRTGHSNDPKFIYIKTLIFESQQTKSKSDNPFIRVAPPPPLQLSSGLMYKVSIS